MLGKSQGQTAGAHAQQIQVSGDLVIVEGVSEERAFEIAHQAAQDVLAEYSAESNAVAMGRIGKFDMAMIRRLKDAGLLGALGDPALQVTMRKAQIGAASTEREDDYDLLASLIEDRAKRANDRPVRAGINRAVEIVDQLDDQALAGLTAMQAATQFRPLGPSIDTGVDTMERLLAQLVDVDLPTGVEWIEHLDVLGAVRIDPVQKFKPFDEYWPPKTPGYVTVGLLDGSEELVQAKKALQEAGIALQVVPHELKPGYVRLPYPFADAVEASLAPVGFPGEQVAELVAIARDRFLVDTVDPGLTAAYMERVRERPVHAHLAEWWSGLGQHFVITTVGRVLGRANAQRLDRLGLLPPLD